MAGVAAVACFAALVATGHPLVGGLVAAGLGAGAWNAWRVQQSAPKVLAGGIVHKGALGGSGVRRLGYVTLLVLACTLAFRPVGWTVALGLAGFQVLLVVNTVAPLVREVRRG
jgi:fermentation-respiration switch protein FrsA (DUF1100 family)